MQDGFGHNSGDNPGGDGGDWRRNPLRIAITAIEALEVEKKAIADRIKAEWAALRAQKYDTKALRHLVWLRKMEAHTRLEFEARLQIYKAAIGDLGDTPLGEAARKKLEEQLEEARNAKLDLVNKPLEDPDDLSDGLGADGSGGSPSPQMPPAVVPQDTADQAREKGAEAARSGKRIIDNPYPANTPYLMAAWEEGWCMEAGSSDGMDIPTAWQKPEKQKPEKSKPEKKLEGKKAKGSAEDKDADGSEGKPDDTANGTGGAGGADSSENADDPPPPPGGSDGDQPGAGP